MAFSPTGRPAGRYAKLLLDLNHVLERFTSTGSRDQNTRGMSLKWWPWPSPRDHPFFLITIYFLFWKALLVGIGLTSPGPGYDTSATLLPLTPEDPHQDSQADGALSEWLVKFVRWDAIYFTQISRRGYLFEQEWAFGWGFTKLVSIFSRGITGCW